MALHNKDYYVSMSDELATELLGTREAHASFKELAELIKTRRERIEELKKLISQKKSASIKAEVALKKAAKAAEEGGKKFTDGELKAKEYEELVSAAKKAEEHAAKLGNSISKLEKELKELEAEESAWLKTEEKLTTKQRRALKKAMAAAAKAEEPEPDDSDEEGEWDDLKDRKTDEELAKELDELFAEDSEDNPAVKEKDPEFQAAMDKFLKAMGDSDDEDEDDEDDSDAKNADEDETGDSSDSSDDTKPVVKPVVFAKKESRRMKMNDLAFYNGIGNDAFEYDRNNGMSDSLRGWIESTLEDDAELAEDSILKHLGAILKKNPNLIEAVKDAIVKAEEYNMPYKTVFVSKVTGETFDKKADAEASIEAFIKAGATTFENCFEIRHTANGAYVEESEVEVYINSFDGDRDALRRQLHMTAPAKAAKPGKGKAAKA